MKTKLLLLLSLITLTGCGHNESSPVDIFTGGSKKLSIVCPTGAPAVAFYNYAGNENFETNAVPKNIVSMMNNIDGKDVVVIDTVSGIKAINNGVDYKIAATITFGNFYICSTGKDDDGILNENDKIVLFGQTQTPDLIFHYLYGDQFNNNIEYVTNAQDAAKCLVSGVNQITKSQIDYVFLAEPAVTTVLNNTSAPTYGKASVYQNIQDLYKEKTGNTMIQASIFISNKVSKFDANALLDSIEYDINFAIENPELLEAMNKEEDPATVFGVAPEMAKKVTKEGNKLGLGFKRAKNIKTEIDNFITLFDNVEETNEEIYF